jgi:predicted nuclease of predicted toxin-antitoxin system
VKFLLDENISYRIVKSLQGIGIQSIHVSRADLKPPLTDQKIWRFAKRNGFIILTFDDDFHFISSLRGFPPKIILFRFGNAPNSKLFHILSENLEIIRKFYEDPTLGVLEVF